jgi:hypothetical protein
MQDMAVRLEPDVDVVAPDVCKLLDEFDKRAAWVFDHELDAGERGWWFGYYLQQTGYSIDVVGRLIWEAGLR